MEKEFKIFNSPSKVEVLDVHSKGTDKQQNQETNLLIKSTWILLLTNPFEFVSLILYYILQYLYYAVDEFPNNQSDSKTLEFNFLYQIPWILLPTNFSDLVF
jgi:hypothetical protein